LAISLGRPAYATGAPIVTANADEFKRIRGLKIENQLD
jgi:predicted nucleic acid-binding protein